MTLLAKTTASLAAAAILATSISVAPTQASANDDVAKAIAGLIFLGVAAKAISEANDSNRRTRNRAPVQPQVTQPTRKYGPCARQRWTNDGWETYRDRKCVKDRKAAKREERRKPPRECLRKRWRDDAWQTFYSQACLRKHGFRT